MGDARSSPREQPDSSYPGKAQVPGLKPPVGPDAIEVTGWEEAYARTLEGEPWEDPPVVRRLMGESGAEAFGYYLSHRIEPERWGLHLSGKPLIGFAKEVLRVLNLGFLELEERVPLEKAREMAFRMTYDIVVNHLSFHASVDAFAAAHEAEDGTPYYGPYQQGPYAASLEDVTGPDGYNWEEVLANVVSLRSFLNPAMTVEFGSGVDSYFADEEKFRWNGFLMSGMLTSELTYVMRPYPVSHKNFTEFLRRRGEVGPYAHMAIQYDLDTEAFHAGLRRLGSLVLNGKEVEDAEKDLLRPADPRVFLLSEE